MPPGCVEAMAPWPAGEGGARGGLPEVLAPEPASPKEREWRTNMGGWRERADRRAEEAQRRELEFKMLLQRRDDEEARKLLEEQRRREAAVREAQRRREAAEYTTWRQDAVLARKAEERARAQEHRVWREDVAKTSRGVAVPCATLKQVRSMAAAATARATAADAKVESFKAAKSLRAGEGCGGAPAEPESARCAATRSLPAWSHALIAEEVLSPKASSPKAASPKASSPKVSSQAQARMCMRTAMDTCCFSSDEQSKLDEEEAWRAAVARNREALVAERAARLRKEAQQQRNCAAAPSVADAAAAVGRPEWGAVATEWSAVATRGASQSPWAVARPLASVRFSECA